MPKKSKPSKSENLEDLAPPTDIDPYAVLSLSKTATQTDIRTAYRKLALKWHPDKHSDKDAAHSKFQEIAFAYAILSDEQRRRRYDSTGSLEDVEDGEFDWGAYFSELWTGVVSGDTIREFKEKYQGSEEEVADVLKAYEDGEGSVQFIIENVMACSYEDEPRFIKIVNDAIAEGNVEKFTRWKKETSAQSIKARKKAAEKEAQEAEELSKELGMKKPVSGMDEGELGKLIRQKHQNQMDGLIARLEAEAQNKGKKSKRKEPTDEEFEAARKKVEGKGSKKRK